MKLIGRREEAKQILKALELERNVLVEGPVGVGKTFLVQQVLKQAGSDYERVDGDSRYTEQKLTGWFDPPLVIKKGYKTECFIEGPLITAMKKGRVLFINELNRMPEAVQNILLPAMDEREITVPRIGKVSAKKGFQVIATQNPREFTATHALSEALLDRFEMVHLAYQSKDEEVAIVREAFPGASKSGSIEEVVELVRSTRNHASIKRGASVRGAIAVIKLLAGGVGFGDAVLMALSSRIELISSDQDVKEILLGLIQNNKPHAEKKNLKLSH